MYEVKIINNKEETIINSVGASQYVPRITGSCKFGINTIDSFTFTIFPNNDGYNLIYFGHPKCVVTTHKLFRNS